MRKRVVPLVLVLAGIAIGRVTSLAPALAQDAVAPAVPAVVPAVPAVAATPSDTTCAVEEVPEGQPRYLSAMRRELTSMGIEDAACEAMDSHRAHCRLTQHGSSSGREYEVNLAYSDVTDTIYVDVDRYLVAPSDGAHTDALLRRLMELNWTMLLGKFEWNPTDGEIRLAMILNTDSNFDRRTFRSAIRTLGSIADRYYAELSRLGETGH